MFSCCHLKSNTNGNTAFFALCRLDILSCVPSNVKTPKAVFIHSNTEAHCVPKGLKCTVYRADKLQLLLP